jgi:hypothetical protein
MSAIAQTRHGQTDKIVPRRGRCRWCEHMLLAIRTLISQIVVVTLARVRAGKNAAALGWMSEQWLAEYRASHP